MILTRGKSARSATTMPEAQLPEPIGTMMASISGSTSATSSASVPTPAISKGSLAGCT